MLCIDEILTKLLHALPLACKIILLRMEQVYMKKIILNVIATIALALFAAPAMANYVLEQGPESYPDLPSSHWAYEAVTFLTDKQIVVGYPDGLYRPDQKVTRGEFATMVIKALGIYEKDICFYASEYTVQN